MPTHSPHDTPGQTRDPEGLWRPAPHSGRGRRPTLNREAITTAAVAMADAEGWDAVTMRKVAAAVGAGVMSLYHYAPDKETLLELMVDHVAGEQAAHPTPATADWRADLRAFAHEQRALLLRHPWLPTALLAPRSLGPNTLAVTEHALGLLRPSGLPAGACLEVFAQVTALVTGHAAYEAARAATTNDPARAAAEARWLTTVLSEGAHPNLAEALAHATPTAPDTTFDRALTRLLDGLPTP
ncbi:TetR/AcrR family transcriptional regulator (plasmid) [Streptomyces sp. BI20]|uniref:TetR/AcrR family transcriptional regulator n=1 Tax=Streptomyces sp. BI20 TaxID=3403460 RepID=UPI003C78C97E